MPGVQGRAEGSRPPAAARGTWSAPRSGWGGGPAPRLPRGGLECPAVRVGRRSRPPAAARAAAGTGEWRAVELLHLPPDWASYLNELAFFDNPSDELFLRGLGDIRAWHYFESGYWVQDEDQRDLANLVCVLDELEKRHDSLDFVAPRCFEVIKLMESVRALRGRARYSPHPVLNDLAVCVAASLAGQADSRALPERLPRARAWRDELAAVDFDHPDVGRAFDYFDRALLELPSQEALTTLLQASELLQVVIDLRSQWRAQLEARYTRWAIPEIGSRLEQAWEEMPSLEVWREEIVPLWTELSLWWGQNRELLTLPCEFLVNWIPQVDQDLDALVSHEFEGDLAGVTDWVEALADDFASARALLRDSSHLRGTQAGDYFELIQGLLANTLPVVVVAELFEQSPPPDSWRPVVEAISEFARGGPRELLYQARTRLLDLVPSEIGWTCPFCSQVNASDCVQCVHCGEQTSVTLVTEM